MSRKAWTVLAALFVAVLLVFWIVRQNGEEFTHASTIRIGMISPFSGDGANYGKAARTGIDMAVDEINRAGGVRGKRLEILYEDDRGNQRDALSAFQKLSTVDKVPAVLGPFYSGNVLACASEANRLQVVLLTASATSDNIREAGEYVFRVCPSNDAQARTVARFAAGPLGLKTGFVLYRNVDYGVTLRDAFLKEFPAVGGTVLGVEAVQPDATDVRAQLTKVAATAPDFILAAVHYPEGGTILRQAKELGISSVIIGTDGGYDPQLLTIAGNAAEGSYWVTIGWADGDANPAVRAFREAYLERYAEDPGVYSGLYYDATHVLARALESAEDETGPSIKTALSTVEYSGPTGVTRFDSAGDVDKSYAAYKVVNGAFSPIPLNLATAGAGGG